MPKPLSKEMREKIIYHKKTGVKNKEISKWLRVSERSIKRIWKLYKEKNSIEPKEHKKGRKSRIAGGVMGKITAEISEQPDITLEELVETFELKISISALSRKLRKMDLTFKKRHCLPKNGSVKTYSNSAESGSNILLTLISTD